MLSSCSSLEKVCVRGRPGVTRLPIATRAAASGPSSTRVACTGNAANCIRPRAWARPTERGLDPTSTNETPVMMSAAISRTHHHWSMTEASEIVTSTAAVVSLVTRRKFAALTCEAGSAAIASSDRRDAAVGRDVDQVGRGSARPSAASAAASRPPKATRSTATAMKTPISVPPRSSAPTVVARRG